MKFVFIRDNAKWDNSLKSRPQSGGMAFHPGWGRTAGRRTFADTAKSSSGDLEAGPILAEDS
jgi:hypothetical protein